MAKIRIKTEWFKEDTTRSMADMASVVALTIWKVCDRAVDNLSKADYDIVTPQRGFKIIAEMAAFLLHYSDRLVFHRLNQEDRAGVIKAAGIRIAEFMQENIHEMTGDTGHDYKADFIDFLNRRLPEYGEFEFPEDKPSYPALRYLGLMLREDMLDSDKTWIMDQVIDIEAPEAMGYVKKAVDGMFDPDADAPVHVGED
jgi:hypothetical protein